MGKIFRNASQNNYKEIWMWWFQSDTVMLYWYIHLKNKNKRKINYVVWMFCLHFFVFGLDACASWKNGSAIQKNCYMNFPDFTLHCITIVHLVSLLWRIKMPVSLSQKKMCELIKWLGLGKRVWLKNIFVHCYSCFCGVLRNFCMHFCRYEGF